MCIRDRHRLDRKTSGALLLAKSKNVQAKMNEIFRDRDIKKYYLAIVRGFTEDKFVIDYPLMNENDKIQEAISTFTTISKIEIPISSGTFPTSRYSLIHVSPETGRRHQIRSCLLYTSRCV